MSTWTVLMNKSMDYWSQLIGRKILFIYCIKKLNNYLMLFEYTWARRDTFFSVEICKHPQTSDICCLSFSLARAYRLWWTTAEQVLAHDGTNWPVKMARRKDRSQRQPLKNFPWLVIAVACCAHASQWRERQQRFKQLTCQNYCTTKR